MADKPWDGTSGAGSPAQWKALSEAYLTLLERSANRSPGLRGTFAAGVRYVFVDISARQRVFDMRALTLGLLVYGAKRSSAANSAHWLRRWLVGQVGAERVDAAIQAEPETSPLDLFGSQNPPSSPTLSISVNELKASARAAAAQTVGAKSFALRHLFAAMADSASFHRELGRMFGLTLGPAEIRAMKLALIDGIMISPEAGETRDRWLATMGLAGDSRDPPPPLVRDGVMGFLHDRAASPYDGDEDEEDLEDGDDKGDDLLGTTADARTLARLLCLEGATPLAVAVFGAWGSGKSTFMEQLDYQVRKLTHRLQKEGAAPTSEVSARFVQNVVQIRFNAWQFVDANLWASLTAEFFDQLRAGGWRARPKQAHAGLVERVNQHVHALTDQAIGGRQAADEAGKTLLQAQTARDKAATVAKKARGAAFGEAAIQALGDAFDSQKDRLAAAGLKDPKAAAEATVQITRDLAESFGHFKAFWTALSKSGWRSAFFIVGALAAALGLLAVVQALLGQLGSINRTTLLALAGGAVTATTAALPAVKLVLGLAKRAGGVAKAATDQEAAALAELLQKETKLREAAEEATARRQAVVRSEQALSRYVDPVTGRNPPRLLRYVLEDDPDTKALEKEIGLIGRTRRLFEALDRIADPKRRTAGDQTVEGRVPDRIILYIDDLDRCTEEQVYAVLQAVHLLLSFKLFAVVVMADVAWVQEALARLFRERRGQPGTLVDGVDPDKARASQYLEKIFQVAFWLNPLDAQAADAGVYGRYVRALAGSPSGTVDLVADDTDGDVEALSKAAPAEGAPGPSDPAAAEPDASAAAKAVEGLDTILLDQVEIDFLALPAIAAIASPTPRGVKRLVNVYQLARMRLSLDGGQPTGPEPDYPLLALMAAIETGQKMVVADGFFMGLNDWAPKERMDQFLRPGLQGAPDKLTVAIASSPEMLAALKAVLALRPNLEVGEVWTVARVVRRYSFNAFS